MYRGFNLNFTLKDNTKYHTLGKGINSAFKDKIKEKLDNYLISEGTLKATSIMQDWFPQIDADIFLSHSHKDEKTALILAGWIYDKLNLKTFIDSNVWGHSNNLLRIINDKYSYNSDKKNYSYEKVNNTSSHVNLMLSAALNRMIDNCECIFFLNTPNSISSNGIISKTYSPWIYSELSTTQIIRKKTPERLMLKTVMFSAKAELTESQRSKLLMEYDIELSHLTDITFEEIEYWIKNISKFTIYPLDQLYLQHPIK